ncbi:tRNA 5-methoxyuridine(34)/uridine 5-oxyacetic acid(34) synthase CmoB [Helicobacter sp. 23-1045]
MFIQNRAKRIAQRLNAKNIAPLIRRISALREKIAESTLKSPSLAEGDKGGGYNSKIIAESQIDSSLRGESQDSPKQSTKSNVKITHPLTPSAREGEENAESAPASSLRDSAKQNRGNPQLNQSCEAPETRPLRGAKNRIEGCSSAYADFLLEAKAGHSPKSEKAAAFWEHNLNEVGGSGSGVQPFLRKKTSESNVKNDDNIADSAKQINMDCHDSATQNLAMTENNADSAIQTKNAESGLNCHIERSEISQTNRDSSLRTSCFAQNDKMDCHDSATQNLAMTENSALDSANPQNQNLDSANETKIAESAPTPSLRASKVSVAIHNFCDSKNDKNLADSANETKFAESRVQIDDIIRVDSANLRDCAVDSAELLALLKDLKPWRKGPFEVCGVEIQSEWNSAIKFNIIKNHLNITGKAVADIGCNNGYYAFRLLPLRPAKIVGFEPSAFCKMQFDLINAFVKSEICFEMLGVEDLAEYDCKFDCILCLGVLYHRTNPLDCLRILKNALNKGGEIFVDTLIIEGSGELVLSPLSYAKMKNVYFIPSIGAFQNWMRRAGFREIELLEVRKTTSIEQRKTAWSGGESLEDFLDKDDKNKTIEGYNAPIRAYFKAKI